MDKGSQWTWITLLRQSLLRKGIHTFLKCEYTEGHLSSILQCSFPGPSSPMVTQFLRIEFKAYWELRFSPWSMN
jgi:hypothetical protein